MDADLKNVRKIVKFMKNEGILKLKKPDLELELSPAALFPEPKSKEKQSTSEEPTQPTRPRLTEEELALWSAPGFSGEARN